MAVIGGGNSGVEAAIDLAGVVAHVTLFEFADALKADAVLVSKLKSLPNVTIRVNAQTTEITGDGQKVNGMRYKDRNTSEEHAVALEGVFVQIGLVPNTEFLKGHGRVEQVRRNCGGCQMPHQLGWCFCSRGCDHGALQANCHCSR